MLASPIEAPERAASSERQDQPQQDQPLSPTDPVVRQRRERRRKRVRNLKRVLLGALLVAAAVGAALALRPKPVPVDVATASRAALTVAVEEAGVTRVKDRYLVSAPVTGNISRVSLEAGDQVIEGSVLSQIAPLQSPLLDQRSRAQAEAQLGASISALGRARAETARAAAALELSQRDLARTKQLVSTGTIAEQALSQAGFETRMREQEHASSLFAEKVAGEQVRLAKAALGKEAPARDSHVEVLAPVAGQILRVHQQSAGVVQIGAPLLEVGDPMSLEVVVDLLTTDAVHVKPGTPVRISGWGGEKTLSAVVRRIEPSAFTRPSPLGVDEQRVNVVVSLSEPHEHWAALGDGYRVEARIELWQGADVLQVPHGAVFRYGEDWAVFVLDGEHARRLPVQLGHRGESSVEIAAGLSEGARLIVHPGDRVKDGIEVRQR
jgi:HlyD family secretion protein